MPTLDDLIALTRARDAAARTLADLDEQYAQMTRDVVAELTRSLLEAHPTVLRYAISVRATQFDDNGPYMGVHLHSIQFAGDATAREVYGGYGGLWRVDDGDPLSDDQQRIAQEINDAVGQLSAQGLADMATGELSWDGYFVLQVSREGIHLARWS